MNKFYTSIVIRWKGTYGFIKAPNDRPGPDIFVHYSDIIPDESGGYKKLQAGALVSFAVEVTDRGPQARNVRNYSKSL